MCEQSLSLEKVLQKMQNSLACTICLDLLHTPMTTKCGHTFCKECLNKLLYRSRNSVPCPLCVTSVTRRSLKVNKKISDLVTAVRTVISSIKKDCGIQESTKGKILENDIDTDSVENEDNIFEESGISLRRGTRKREPVFLHNTEQNQTSNNRPKCGQSKIKTAEKVNRKENKKPEDLDEDFSLTTGTSDFHGKQNCKSPINNLPYASSTTSRQVEKVEKWLNENKHLKLSSEMEHCETQPKESDDNESLLTQVFEKNMLNLGHQVNNSDLKSNGGKDFTGFKNGLQEESPSQASTVLFNLENTEIIKKTYIQPHPFSNNLEDEFVQDEVGSELSEKENMKSFSVICENKKEVKKKVREETTKLLEDCTKNVENENVNKIVLESVTKDTSAINNESHLSTLTTKKGEISPGADDHKPNKRGHNIRFASEVKLKFLETAKPSKLAMKSKTKKSPGWSRIAAAKRDLRSNHTTLDLTNIETKTSLDPKTETSIAVPNYSQESVMIIEEDPTQPMANKSITDRITKRLKTSPMASTAKAETNRHLSAFKTRKLSKRKMKAIPLTTNETKIKSLSESTEKETSEFVDTGLEKSTKEASNQDKNEDSQRKLSSGKASCSPVNHSESGKLNITITANKDSIIPLDANEFIDQIKNTPQAEEETCKEMVIPNVQSVTNLNNEQEIITIPDTNDCQITTAKPPQSTDHPTDNLSIGDENRITSPVNVRSCGNQNTSQKESKRPRIEIEPPDGNIGVEIHGEGCPTSQKTFVPFLARGSLSHQRPYSQVPQSTRSASTCLHSIPCELFQVISKFASFLTSQQCQDRFPLAQPNCDTVQNQHLPISQKSKTAQLKDVETLSTNEIIKNNDLKSHSDSHGHKTKLSGENRVNDEVKKSSEDILWLGSCGQCSRGVLVKDDCSHMSFSDHEGETNAQCCLSDHEGETNAQCCPVESKTTKASQEMESEVLACSSTIPNDDKLNLPACEPKLLKNAEGNNTSKTDTFSATDKHIPESPQTSSASPINFKRNKISKILESSSDSGSEDELPCAEMPYKKRRLLSPCSSPSLARSENRIDSEDMADFERYDENVWDYFKTEAKEQKEDSPIKENENDLTKSKKKELLPEEDLDLPMADDTNDVCTDDVLRNIESDLAIIVRNRKEIDREAENDSESEAMPVTINICSQDSIVSSSTANGLSASTRDLFRKCNMSLSHAREILNNSGSHFPEDKVSGDPVVQMPDDDDDTCNESHSSAISTQSFVISTQQRNKVKDEVDSLKSKILALEEEMKRKESAYEMSLAKCKELPKKNDEAFDVEMRDAKVASEDKKNDDSEWDSDQELFKSNPCPQDTVSEPKTNIQTKPSVREIRKPMTIVCTGLCPSETAKVQSLVDTLGVSGSSLKLQWSKNTTHVIVKTDEEGMTVRTLKYLFGVASGAWVVSLAWVVDSLESAVLLPEDKYEAIDCTGTAGPYKGRNISSPLFSNCQFCLVPPFEDVTPEQIADLIATAGGTVVKSFDEQNAGIKLIVGNASEDENKLEERPRVIVSPEWIIECIGMCSLVSLSNYVIGIPSTCEITASEIPPSLMFETQEIPYLDL